jgi:hypothetical protein
MADAGRWLSEEHSSLSGASLGKIVSTGLLLGVVHVLTGGGMEPSAFFNP